MGEFASNAKANTGVALGATGLGIAVANAMGNGGLGGLVGNLFGNNAAQAANAGYISQLQAENSLLKSENYADKVGREVYQQSVTDNNNLRVSQDIKHAAAIEAIHDNAVNVARLEEQLKCCCEKNALEAKFLDQKIDSTANMLTGKINETALALNGKIDTNEAHSQGRFSTLDQTIACIAGKVDAITTTSVKFSKICPQPVPAVLSCPQPNEPWYPNGIKAPEARK